MAARGRPPRRRRRRCLRPSSRWSISATIASPARASTQRTGLASTSASCSQLDRRALGQRGAADAYDVAAQLDAGAAQERAGEGARRHACRRLPRARPLEHVAQVVRLVLEGSGQVGVARPRVAQAPPLAGLVRLRVGRHDVAPVRVVSVAHQQVDGAAERQAVADATQDLDGVGLDLHAPAAAVAALAAPQVRVDRRALHRHAGRQAVDDDGDSGAMCLAGSEEAQHRAILRHAFRAVKERGGASQTRITCDGRGSVTAGRQ